MEKNPKIHFLSHNSHMSGVRSVATWKEWLPYWTVQIKYILVVTESLIEIGQHCARDCGYIPDYVAF